MGEDREIENKENVRISFKAVNKEFTGGNDPELVAAKTEYQEVWDRDGGRILEILERTTGLSFKEEEIPVHVAKKRSSSGVPRRIPMVLRSDVDVKRKTGILIHEIGHRLLQNHTLQPTKREEDPIEEISHRILFLFLYDVWVELYGEEFAKYQIEEDRKLTSAVEYGRYWDQVLGSFTTKEERLAEFGRIVGFKKQYPTP